MLLIDKIIWGILCLIFLSGWMRGFLRSLVGPFAFILCTLSAVIFYDLNHNVLIASVIIFAGTISLAAGLSVLLTVGVKTLNKEYRGKVFLMSRILGAIINIAWQGNVLFLTLILFSILPAHKGILTQVQREIPQSTMMNYYKLNVVNKNIHYEALVESLEIIHNPERLQAITNSERFEAFAQHPKVQAFANDPAVRSSLAERNMIKLVKTQALRDLVTNDSAMYLFTKIADIVYTDSLDRLSGTENIKP